MTSRRTMTRSFSGNGRTSSFSEEEGSSSSSRSESRNTYLSNVRPENRSTLCSVMAQLTEDIQPTFETTLKPKAVSENCNVKFSCVVSGYPTPELKWYKDDVEMDRYCGLPKYEIRRNGKTHTLHIYNCTLDDAAIYQVSASNSKGIVSCSGVLEVGTMNEYKIHQRFFAKLKQKAERKKKDLEDQTKKVSKENIQKKELQRSPEHPQRKRSIPLADKLSVELPGEAAMPNGIGSDLKDMDTSPINVESRPEETLYMCNGLKTQEQTQEKVGNAQNERLHPELKTEKNISVNVQVLDESKSISLFQNNGGDDNLIQEHTNMRGLSRGLGCASENIPKIQISDSEDISDKTLFTEDFSPDNHVRFPKTKIIDPEIKETTLPLTILALSKLESSHLQKHDTTHVSDISTQHDSEPDCPVPFSTPSIHDLSPTQKVKEVAQSLFEQQELHVQSSEQPHQMDNTSIPVINVMDTEDKENGALSTDSKVHQVCEVSRVPLIVVPPISVTCHESDSEPSQSKCREKETSADTQRGTKSVDNTMRSERIQTCGSDDISEKSRNDKTPIMLSETLIPKVGGNVQSLNEPPDKNSGPDLSKPKPLKEIKTEIPQSVEDYLKNKPSIERLSSKPPTYPSLSPASLRKFMTKTVLDSENDPSSSVPVISVSDHQSDKTEEDLSGGSTPTSSLSCESSPRLKRRDSLTLIRSATPEELASGARRKIFISKTKEEMEGSMFGMQDSKKESPYMSPSQARRAALLQPSIGQKTPPVERRSPLLNRRKATLDVPKVMEEPSAGEPVGSKTEDKLAEKKIDPLKAPQVIRKIRAEPFPDASGHLKLWCQFFNVLTDSTIKWYKEDDEILEIKRSGGDESQVALAIVLASNQDCGVYGCTISNDYGSDTTDFLLSSDVLSEILLKDDLEVGEEIEMTPLLFTRGLADCGSWGEKYFGRIFTEALQVGEGCTHKTSRVKVIYGLDPVFESGSTCIIKIQNPISYGNRQETNLTERNLDITKQECKVQNLIREYCKIFAAEARVIENFGLIPRYLMYRPANSVPYATVESDLSGTFTKYCTMGPKDQLISQNTSEIEQKCCTFQHWIHQWTHGNLLVTQLEGVETKLTNVKVVTKSKGYQGLTECGSPQVFDQFLTHHQCTYYCGLLGLRPLRSLDTLQQPAKIKGSKSPLLNRKLSTGSPQLQRKGQSPQMSRKGNSSPKVAKKVQATDDSKTGGENKPAESQSVTEMR
uniref:non-specific serine/threonine protein kinase n=1 Tax=Oryzias sinensis TaxID=183150 RepID=A0A8C7XNH3_9TELE